MLDAKVAVVPQGAGGQCVLCQLLPGRVAAQNAPVRSPDTDGPDLAGILGAAAPLPHGRAHVRPPVRVMNQVQVDVVEPGLLQRAVDRLLGPGRVGPVVHEFRREVDFGARDAGGLDKVVDRATAVLFIFVPFRACVGCEGRGVLVSPAGQVA